MKKTILTLALAGCVLSAMAQINTEALRKINPAGRIFLQELRQRPVKPAPGLGEQQIQSSESDPVISAIVNLTPGCNSSVLDGLNVEVLSELGTVLVIQCPASEIEKVAALPQVVNVGFGEELKPQLDFARPSGIVNDVQNGFEYNGKTRSFDGTGVVCGMMDVGLEANHINFKNTDGTSRIMRLWHMNSNNGSSEEYTDKTIGNFTTDATNQGHATHVAGIIGGGYKGNGTFMYQATGDASSTSKRTDQPIPFYGVATGADFAFAVGQLYTPNIIQGVTNIINYATDNGQPVVVNLSLGSTTGPHDGTDYYARALSALGEKGIICMSAGNDGDEQISVYKELGSVGNDAYLRTLPVYKNGSSFLYGTVSGVADLWTNSSNPVTVSIKAYNDNVATATEIATVNAANQRVSTDGNTEFSSLFSGSFTLTSNVDPNNNRFNVYMEFNGVQPLASNTTRVLMIEVSGDDETKVWIYGNGVYFENRKSADDGTPAAFTKGSAAQSINNTCCGSNIISVGAYTTRTRWGLLNTSVYQYTGSGYSLNAISPFSSYGTSYQGTQLPLICAPGANIISSYSSYYAGANASTTMSGMAESGGKTYYWGPMQGTSMSCPFVSGTIGLWLQADPSLNFDKVMDVISKTSDYNSMTMRGGRWGYGKINALNGIKQVLADRAAGLGNVWQDSDSRLVVTDLVDALDVFVAGDDTFTATLYDLQGRPVASAQSIDGTATLATPSLRHGVYILEARTASGRLTTKISR